MPRSFAHDWSVGASVTDVKLDEIEADLTTAYNNAETAVTQLGRSVDNILNRGAVAGDNSTNATANTTAINAAASAMSTAGGGTVYLPRGVYQVNGTLTLYSNVQYLGDPGTRVKKTSGSSFDLLKTFDFDTLFSGTTTAGPSRFRLANLIFDGNKAGSAAGYIAKIYGSNYTVDNCHFCNGAEAGVWSRWGLGGTNMESHWTNVKIYNNNGVQLTWQGPHDTQFTNLIVFMDVNGGDTTAAGAGRHGIKTSSPAGGEQFTNVHVWGYHDRGIWLEAGIRGTNITSEGAQINVLIDAADSTIEALDVFGTNNGGFWTTETGVQIGLSGGTIRGSNRLTGRSSNWASGDVPFSFAADDGSVIDMLLRAGGATAAYTGNPWMGGWGGENIRIVCMDDPSKSLYTGPMRFTGAPSNTVGVNGQLGFRTDGGTGTTLYHKRAGSWVAIL